MGACCSPDVRPVLQIKVLKVKGMRPLDDDGESDAYILCRYGSTRFEEQQTPAVKTKHGNCSINHILAFNTGGPSSKSNLEVVLMDRDLLKSDDYGGQATIWYGNHPENPENEDLNEDLSLSKRSSGGATAVAARYNFFLPREWNAYTTYSIDLYNKDNVRSGTVELKIAFWDKKGRILDGASRAEDEHQLIP